MRENKRVNYQMAAWAGLIAVILVIYEIIVQAIERNF